MVFFLRSNRKRINPFSRTNELERKGEVFMAGLSSGEVARIISGVFDAEEI
jgi:hypothetical protein